MNKTALVVSHGLHCPWNMGEVVLSNNFSEILSSIYQNVKILSTIDTVRVNIDEIKTTRFDVKYFSSRKDLHHFLANHLKHKSGVDLHLVNASLISFLNLVPFTDRTYLYQFAYNVFNNPDTIIRSLGVLPLTYLGKIRIITTSSCSFYKLNLLFRKNFYYVPAPMTVLVDSIPSKERTIKSELTLLYLGHGSYLRFPYDKVLRPLIRLHSDGISIKLRVYISKQGYADYENFVEGLNRFIQDSNFDSAIQLTVANLDEAEKFKIISEADILLFPALVNAAIDPPLVVLEAMSLGTCVIASSIQSIPFLLANNRGIVINTDKLEEDLYVQLKRLSINRKLPEEYASNAKKWVLKEYNKQTVAKKIKEILGN